MKRAETRLTHSPPRLKFGAVRLAIVGVLLASTTAGGLLLHSTAKKPALAAVPAKHGCGCSAEPMPSAKNPGTLYHYAKDAHGRMRLAQAVSGTGGADTTSASTSAMPPGIIIPANVGYKIVVHPGQQITLAVTTPLPYSKVPGAGQWFARFGTITPDGVHYTAPMDIPPLGIDEISYFGGTNLPYLHMTIFVQDPSVPDDSVWNAPDEDLPYKTFTTSQTGKVGIVEGKATGFLLPAWVDRAGYELYIPGPQWGEHPPRKRLPVNPPPPYPPGSTTYNCTPGASYDVASNPYWLTPPHYPLQTGWKTIGTQNVYVSLDAEAQISSTYHIDVSAGYHNNINIQYQDIAYDQVNYTDHYTCANNGTEWTFTGTTMCEQKGDGRLWSPVWESVLQGWPANGSPIWLTTPACHNI